MKIIPAFKANYTTNYPKNNKLPALQESSKNPASGHNVSFGSFKSGLARFFDAVERKGFFAEFLVVDFFSMILPRVLIGLGRDREKTGEVNYKSGIEEAGRELASGPSMFLIPMGILYFYQKYAPASHMSKDVLGALTNNMGQVVNELNDVNLLTNKDYLNKSLANKLFEQAFEGVKLDNRESLKAKFSELLNKSAKTEPKSAVVQWFKGVMKLKQEPDSFAEAATEFEKHIVLINNSNNLKAPGDTKRVNLVKNGISARELFEDFHNYSKDVLTKFTKLNFATNAVSHFKEEAKTVLKRIQTNRANIKLATAVTGFLAVGAFLLYLPKLYQQGNISPAMESAKRAKAEGLAKGGANESS
ncbi:MAG: hypothetical protein WCG95_06780 [bacterium]